MSYFAKQNRKALPQHPNLHRWAVIAILLAGVWLRWASLAPMNTMLHYDEAYNALDALNVLRKPQLTPFFPGNFGREGGFIYWLLPFVGLLNGNPLALRLAATVIGILTLAAAYKLAKELLGPRGAVWVLGALAALYWHVHLSHLALRGNLLVLIGTLSAAWLLEAYRTNRTGHWVRAGMVTGLLTYTYFASVTWIGYAGLFLLAWFFFNKERRTGALIAGISVLAISLPMALFIRAHPEYFFSRPQTVAVLNRAGILHNLRLWGRAWFSAGDPNVTFNYPGRPILDVYSGVLWAIGIASLFFLVRRRWHIVWFLGWAFLTCVPSLISNQAPHFLRASGLTIPTAIAIGAGAWSVQLGLERLGNAPLAVLIPLLMLVLTGKTTYIDFHERWIHHPETALSLEQPLNEAVNLIRDTAPPNAHVYFSPFSPTHPVIGYRSPQLAPRPIGASDSHQCLVVADGTSIHMSLTLYEPGFYENLSQWRDTSILYEAPGLSGRHIHYTIFRADPYPQAAPESHTEATFGDVVRIRTMRPISKTVPAGTTLPIALGIRPLHAPEQPLSLFIHLYGDPTPYEGGHMWGQADSQICATYPSHLWHMDETIIQTFDLTLPANLPAGDYIIATGVYLFPNGDRLPITDPDLPQAHYYELAEIHVP